MASFLSLWGFVTVTTVTFVLLTALLAERQRRGVALRQSEERLRLAADAAQIGIWDWDLASNTIAQTGYQDPGLGLGPPGVVGSFKETMKYVLPEDRPLTIAATSKAIESGEPLAVEFRNLHPDGRSRWMSARGMVHRDAAGRAVRMIGVTQDVTERKLAEEALRRSESLLRSIIDNSTAVIYVKRSDGRFLLINRWFEELFGVKLAEIVGKTDYDFFPRENADAFRANDLAVLRERRSIESEEMAPHPDGMHTYISVKFPLFDASGEPYAVCGISTDITERKRTEKALRLSEERTRLIVDNALAAVVTIDAAGRIAGWNPQAESTFGWTRAEALGRPLDELIVPARFRESLRSGLSRWAREGAISARPSPFVTEGLHRDGREIPVEIAITPYRLGDQPMVSAFIRDITDRRQAEERARRHEAELAHVGRLATLGEMASMIAHELNQPLAAITSFTQGCVRRLDSGTASRAELLEKMREAVAEAVRAGEIVRWLKNFIRKEEPRRSEDDINAVVQQVASLASPELKAQGIALRLELGPRLPRAFVDRIQIEQVLLNLVRNALEAMAETEARNRRITIRTAAGDGGEIEVTVLDQGPGVPEADRERVFNSFFSTKEKGMGLGLAISRSIIEAHGGKIRVEPAGDGPGAAFAFSLPSAAAARAPAASGASPVSREGR